MTKQDIIKMIFKYMQEDDRNAVDNYLNNNKTYLDITDSAIIDDLFKSKLDYFMDNITISDGDIIRRYSGYDYKNINAFLRDNWSYDINGKLDDDKKDFYLDYSNNLEKLINLFPKLDTNIRTYRGVPLSYFKEYGISDISDLKKLEGGFLYDEAFISTSLVKGTDYFKKSNELGLNYNVRIVYSVDGDYSSGAILSHDNLSYSKDQLEFLINKGSLSKVDKVVINDDNTAVLYVTLVPTIIWDKNRYLNNEKNKLM